MNQVFPTERIDQIAARPEDFRLLDRLSRGTGQVNEPVGDEKKILIIDVETTGFDPATCQIIEFGFAHLSYSPSLKRITSIDKIESLYNEPLRSIPKNITELTGITDEMVAGHSVSIDDLRERFSGDPVVLAHNAEFDRSFIDHFYPNPYPLRWACSSFGVNWRKRGLGSSCLQHVGLMNGFFFSGHRAEVDCLAVAEVFIRNESAFEELLDLLEANAYALYACGAGYEVKDILRDRGYRFQAKGKVWWKEVRDHQLQLEREFLGELYPGGESRCLAKHMDARSRYLR